MSVCCPPGEGCNSLSGQEPCSLSRLRRASSPEADRALKLWRRYVQARGAARERRVLRRAYGRTRDQALGLWTPWASA
ncbi:MAG: hypothetical protein ACR2KV_09460 [Solirubrobacteraceae bacterium]